MRVNANRLAVQVAQVALLCGCQNDGGEGMLYHNDFTDGDGGWASARTLLSEAQIPRDGGLALIEVPLGGMPVREALQSVDRDFGLIVFPVSDSPLPADQPSGRIEVQSSSLVRP